MALMVVFILGLLSYKSLPRAEDPGFVVRKARVITVFPGASPDRIEKKCPKSSSYKVNL